MKQTIRLKESQLKQIIRESIVNVLSEEQLNELDPRTLANYARGREAQANGERPLSPSQQRKGLNQQQIQQQAAQGQRAAQNAWNKQYGYDFDNGNGHYGYQRMGGEQFVHNGNNPYGISSKYGNNGETTNMAYNPSNNKQWTGYGDGTSETIDSTSERELGDNGAYKVARQMANGTGHYNKQTGKWS